MTAADRPYGKFYDFYSVSLETFGSIHVFLELLLNFVCVYVSLYVLISGIGI